MIDIKKLMATNYLRTVVFKKVEMIALSFSALIL